MLASRAVASLALDPRHPWRDFNIDETALPAVAGRMALNAIRIFMHLPQIIKSAGMRVFIPTLKMFGVANHAFAVADIISSFGVFLGG